MISFHTVAAFIYRLRAKMTRDAIGVATWTPLIDGSQNLEFVKSCEIMSVCRNSGAAVVWDAQDGTNTQRAVKVA